MHCNREICYTKDKQVITEKKIIVTKGRTEMLCNILKKTPIGLRTLESF